MYKSPALGGAGPNWEHIFSWRVQSSKLDHETPKYESEPQQVRHSWGFMLHLSQKLSKWQFSLAQLVWAVEYTNCFSAEGKDPPHNKYPRYDIKQSDGEVPVMTELWGIWSIPSLPSLTGPLWPRVVTPDRVLSMGQTELNCVLMLNWIVWIRTVWLNRMAWNRNDFNN